jgi:hypothetical protein
MTWKTVGNVFPSELMRARIQLHWAAQLVSAPGTSLLPAEADHAHTNLGWDPTLGVLVGRNARVQSLKAGLVFEGLELLVIDAGREHSSLRLAGHTLQQALAWLGEEIAGDQSMISAPVHEMLSHVLGEGGMFSDAGSDARAELAAWFANAFGSIRKVVADEPAASPVRCWPHHFDVASLISLDAAVGAEEARSIGVGFSPGDGSYDQPYFYVTPWPYPEREDLPPLAAGAHWHRSGWTGAVLTAERLISAPFAAQQRTVHEALDRAVAACRELFGA